MVASVEGNSGGDVNVVKGSGVLVAVTAQDASRMEINVRL